MKKDIYKCIVSGNYREAIGLLAEMAAEPNIIRITDPSTVAPLFAKYAGNKQEHFLVLTLDGAHQPIAIHEVTKGLTNRTIVHPREVFRVALLDSAVAIIIAHNHPSGQLDPSSEDKELTMRLKDAAEVMGIALLDHIVVGIPRRSGTLSWTSMVELGILRP